MNTSCSVYLWPATSVRLICFAGATQVTGARVLGVLVVSFSTQCAQSNTVPPVLSFSFSVTVPPDAEKKLPASRVNKHGEATGGTTRFPIYTRQEKGPNRNFFFELAPGMCLWGKQLSKLRPDR